MRVNVLLLLLSSWLIADSQRLFNYYDYFLNKVSVSPALIVDKNQSSSYVLTYKTSTLYVWNYQSRSLQTTITPYFTWSYDISINGREIIVRNSSGIVYLVMQNNTSSYSVMSTIPIEDRLCIHTMDPYATVAILDYNQITIYRSAGSNLSLQQQIYSTNNNSNGSFCSGGSKLLTFDSSVVNIYTRDSRTLNYSYDSSYRIAQEQTYYFATNQNCSLLVRGLYDGLLIAVNFDSKYLNLPRLITGTSARHIQTNLDGSAISIILYTGEVIEYQKDVHYPNTSGVNSSSTCIWYYTACVYNCSSIPYSTSLGFQTICQCSYPTVWMNGQCQRNCSADPNAVGASPHSVAECACNIDYSWDSSIQTCLVNCSSMPYSTGRSYYGQGCSCQNGFIWNGSQCVINCGQFNYAAGRMNLSRCNCVNGFYWWNSQHGCVVNCSYFKNATYNDSYSSCSCTRNYTWSNTRCKWDCSTLPNANPGLTDYNCTCKSAYYYRPEKYACQINCSSISGSTGKSISSTECQCSYGYKWSDETCNRKVSLAVIIGVALTGGLLLLALIIFLSWCCCCRRVNSRPVNLYPPRSNLPGGQPQPLNNSLAYQSAQHINVRNNPSSMSIAAGIGPRTTRIASKRQTINEVVCSICLLGSTNVLTNCRHRFHRECIQLWMTKDRSCPNCRAPNITVT